MNLDLDIDTHSPERTREAARLAAEAVRFLNHATGHHAAEALDWPSDADSVTGSAATLVMRLPQLLGQIADWLGQQDSAGRLQIGYGPFEGEPALAVAQIRLLSAEASVMAGGLYERLRQMAEITSTIGGVSREDDELAEGVAQAWHAGCDGEGDRDGG